MQTYNLDLSKKRVISLLYVKQRDVGTKILVEITDDGKEYTIPEDATWSVWFSGKSGEGNYTTIGGKSAFTVEGNTVTVELIYQMLNNPGEHLMCLVMNGADGSQLGLWNIPYFVEAIPGADSEVAQQYYQAFVAAQQKIEEAADRADADMSIAVAAAEQAEAAAGRAEEAAERAEAGVGASIIVGIDEGNTATYTASEIYSAIQNKQTVVYRHDDEFISLKRANPSMAVFSKTGYPTEFDIFDIEIDANGIVGYKTSFGSELVEESVPVSYLPQTPTKEQQAQARANIGVDVFYVTLTEDLGGDNYSCDHTASEIYEAVQSGKTVFLVEAFDASNIILNLSLCSSDSARFVYFSPENDCAREFIVGNNNTAYRECRDIVTYSDGYIYVKTPAHDDHVANKAYVDNAIGEIETALDSILEIQNELIGGDGA